MEFQTLKKNNKRKWIIESIISIALIVTITFIGTMAKYKSTSHTSIAKGVINYNYDLDIVAVNVQNDDGKYVSSTDIPVSGYTLNKERSFCKVGNEKVNVSMEYKGKVYISTNKKGTKCELYFDKGAFKTKDLILSQNIIDEGRASGEFNSVYIDKTPEKIFNSTDDDGITYFFAGANPNNWVKFGTNKEGQDLYWRIIRINGDNSIRLIYNGPTTNQAGETTQIGPIKFNEKSDDNAYVGYMYGQVNNNDYAKTHENINDSTIKTYLDTWYEENLKMSYAKYIDTNAGFCGDRLTYNGLKVWNVNYLGDGFNKQLTMYSYGRLKGSGSREKNFITYKCIRKNDLYTLNESTKGNKALSNPVGILTMDEAFFAGLYLNWSNIDSNWLVTNESYWTMTPSHFDGRAVFYYLRNNNNVNQLDLINSDKENIGARPVINLKADALTTGTGTTTDPYRIS